MTQRRFIDDDGVQWMVYDVVAQGNLAEILKPSRPRLADPYQFRRFTAWLCFESDERDEKRRLHPIPESWPDASSDELRRLLALAERVLPLH
jgi:hypothetical protein